MKQKIKEALKQGHKKLGLSDEVFERVAASVETFITDESQIDGFVTSESTLSLLRSYQSINDKVRDLERFVPKPNNTPKVDEPDNGNNPPEPKPNETPDFKAMLAEALAEVVNPLKEELAALKGEKASELAIKSAQEKFGGDAWVNGYPELRDSAWAQAMRIYERTGKSMTADELHAEAMEIFKPLAKAKGLDISKPFQSDGGAGDNHKARFEQMAKRIEEQKGAVAGN